MTLTKIINPIESEHPGYGTFVCPCCRRLYEFCWDGEMWMFQLVLDNSEPRAQICRGKRRGMMANLQVADVLRNGLESFGSNGENWVKGGANSLCDKQKKCASLAIGEQPVSQTLIHRAKTILCDVIGIDVMGLYGWNDAKERTWPQIKAAYEKAIDAAKKKG